MAIFVTGGAGFIGSQFVRDWVARYPSQPVINFDNLTYAGNLENLASVAGHPAYSMVKGDITDPEAVRAALPQGCDAIVHFAAESHVDRSILSAGEFVRTNVLGTQVLLDIAREKRVRRFLHISTDEVGGSIPLAASSVKTRRSHRAVLTPPARPRRSIWSAPRRTPSAWTPSSRAPATTTAPISSPRSSSRWPSATRGSASLSRYMETDFRSATGSTLPTTAAR